LGSSSSLRWSLLVVASIGTLGVAQAVKTSLGDNTAPRGTRYVDATVRAVDKLSYSQWLGGLSSHRHLAS
jgi:hypothetical protein